MKRTKSSLSLQNMAISIKKSLCSTPFLFSKPQRTLRISNSTKHLPLRQDIPSKQSINRQQRRNRIFILEKQVTYLQRQIQESKSSIRNYSKQLGEYQQTSQRIEEIQKDIKKHKEMIIMQRNQIMMLQEEISSKSFNASERIAQKEYYDELIQTYQHQYQSQSKLLFEIISHEDQIKQLERQILMIEDQMSRNQKDLDDWKKDIEFDLNEHKVKNNIKMARVELIEYEDKSDLFCTQNNLRKIRQLCCLYFKTYSKKNGVGNEEAQHGIDIFICRNGLVQDFSEFIRQRLVYNRPRCEFIEKYLITLTKIENIVRKSSTLSNKKIFNQFNIEFQENKRLKKAKALKIQQNLSVIKKLSDQIDNLFNNDSIAVIQYMRQANKNKYDLKQIKKKLKQNKKQQKIRMQTIKSSISRSQQLEAIIEKQSNQSIMQSNNKQIQQIAQTMITNELSLQQLKTQKQHFLKDKQRIQELISNAITTWKERDEKKLKLKALYKELQNIKQSNDFNLTRNTTSRSFNPKQSQTVFNSKKEKLQQEQKRQNCKRQMKLSRNSSILSLNPPKSTLSLTNPYQKIMERQSHNAFKPIIEDCQLILSRQLTSKKNLKEKSIQLSHGYDSRVLAQSNDNNPKKYQLNFKKQKDKFMQRIKKGENCPQHKLKKDSSSKTLKGKIKQNDRDSLSKLLISKFNR